MCLQIVCWRTPCPRTLKLLLIAEARHFRSRSCLHSNLLPAYVSLRLFLSRSLPHHSPDHLSLYTTKLHQKRTTLCQWHTLFLCSSFAITQHIHNGSLCVRNARCEIVECGRVREKYRIHSYYIYTKLKIYVQSIAFDISISYRHGPQYLYGSLPSTIQQQKILHVNSIAHPHRMRKWVRKWDTHSSCVCVWVYVEELVVVIIAKRNRWGEKKNTVHTLSVCFWPAVTDFAFWQS